MLARRHQNSDRAKVARQCAAHRQFVRGFACAVCSHRGDRDNPIEAAHYRLGTHAGVGLKPADRHCLPLCRDCHRTQHTVGEASFWAAAGVNPVALIAELVRRSPRRAELEAMV